MKHRALAAAPTAVRRAARRAGVIAAVATAAAAVAAVLGVGTLLAWAWVSVPGTDTLPVPLGAAVALLVCAAAAVVPLRAVHRAVERWAVRRGAAATIRHLDSLDPAAACDELERYIVAALARHDVDVVVGLLSVMRRYDLDRAAGLSAAMVVRVLADDGALTVSGGRGHYDNGDTRKGDAGVRPPGR